MSLFDYGHIECYTLKDAEIKSSESKLLHNSSLDNAHQEPPYSKSSTSMEMLLNTDMDGARKIWNSSELPREDSSASK